MSANNWRLCPTCRRDMRLKREAEIARVQKTYGEVSSEVFVTELRVAEALPFNPKDETLREDYEIGTNDNGLFKVSYSCSCAVCGFGFRYDHTEQVTA